MSDLLEKIRGTNDEKIKRRIRHKTFAKTVIFLVENFERGNPVHARDLADFLGVDVGYAWRILRQFVSLGLIDMRRLGSLTEWVPLYNNNELLIKKWFEEAKKTLGL
ncbi:MAG: hypothetical protein DRJ31_03120 [Candidatus Methanomethylicota archaeon]|uniref:HTH iclR-type domain-containing protein n=1 Tax=Thermoproteota archaeon TaxID=2056631 RepID=A0A497ES86_9CREN|nr:MAG: hypothetical protein DRJ31_03120 [Candidatus Verstraetearchaeota archaeon]